MPRPRRATPLSSPQRSAGFTAIELTVVISILAILAALALPGFRDTLQRYRVQRAADDLVATLYFARSEAIRRAGRISLRKSPGGSDCDATAGPEWNCGWSVFLDANEDGILDMATGGGDRVLQQSQVPKGVRVTLFKGSAGGPAAMTADRWGRFGGLGALSFALQPIDSLNPELAMEVCLASGGRLRVLKGPDSCRS